MTKKPKTTSGKTVGRSSITGQVLGKTSSSFAYVERIPRAGGSQDGYTIKGAAKRVINSATSKGITSLSKSTTSSSTTSSPVKYEPKLARPLEHKVDPRAFATELLSSDKIIMDILSK